MDFFINLFGIWFLGALIFMCAFVVVSIVFIPISKKHAEIFGSWIIFMSLWPITLPIFIWNFIKDRKWNGYL